MSDWIDRRFGLRDHVVVITGGAGFLGETHAEAICESGGRAVLLDRDQNRLANAQERHEKCGREVMALVGDVTSKADVERAAAAVVQRYGRIDGLVNNAAINPNVGGSGLAQDSRFEDYPLESWARDLEVTLTGAFLCCQAFGGRMAQAGRGAIVNIASDLALVSPDNRVYWDDAGTGPRAYKPVSYPVAKTGLLGLTRYLSTYWAQRGVRVNTLCPGGVLKDQDAGFLDRVAERIPLGRLADRREYQGALLFLLSEASSYITGASLVADGGRTVW